MTITALTSIVFAVMTETVSISTAEVPKGPTLPSLDKAFKDFIEKTLARDRVESDSAEAVIKQIFSELKAQITGTAFNDGAIDIPVIRAHFDAVYGAVNKALAEAKAPQATGLQRLGQLALSKKSVDLLSQRSIPPLSGCWDEQFQVGFITYAADKDDALGPDDVFGNYVLDHLENGPLATVQSILGIQSGWNGPRPEQLRPAQ